MRGVVRAGFNVFIALVIMGYASDYLHSVIPIPWMVFTGLTFIIINWTKE